MPIKDYLEAGNNKSSMRLGFVWSVATGCIGGFILALLDIILNHGTNLLGVAAVIAAWQGFAFGFKFASGKAEVNNADNPRP